MVFPLRDPPAPLDPDADLVCPDSAANREREHAAAEYGSTEPAGDRDLQRLEASIQWVEREAQLVRREATRRADKKPVVLPRAAQLPPVSGIPLVNAESAVHPRETATFLLAPPLAHERLQRPVPRRRRRGYLRAALFILIASMIVGSITYRRSIGELFPASVPAQAAHLQAR
jgi:hypothetical protein